VWNPNLLERCTPQAALWWCGQVQKLCDHPCTTASFGHANAAHDWRRRGPAPDWGNGAWGNARGLVLQGTAWWWWRRWWCIICTLLSSHSSHASIIIALTQRVTVTLLRRFAYQLSAWPRTVCQSASQSFRIANWAIENWVPMEPELMIARSTWFNIQYVKG